MVVLAGSGWVMADTAADAKAKLIKRRFDVSALADKKDPASEPALKEALIDKDGLVRLAAVRGLHAINAQDAAPSLAGMLVKDPDPAVREEAALALKDWQGPDVLPALIRGAKDSSPEVRVVCIQALGASTAPTARAAVIRAAKDPAPEVRRTVMDQFAHASDPAVVPVLTAGLKDVDPAVRANAALGIGFYAKLHMPSALPGLLTDPDDEVRASAARAMAQAGDARGTPVAMDLLKSTNPTARQLAVEALGYTHGPEAKAALATMAANDPDVTMREAAQLALERMGHKTK